MKSGVRLNGRKSRIVDEARKLFATFRRLFELFLCLFSHDCNNISAMEVSPMSLRSMNKQYCLKFLVEVDMSRRQLLNPRRLPGQHHA